MTALENDAALRNLSQFVNIMHTQNLQQSPEKLAGLDDIMQNVVSGLPKFVGMPELTPNIDIKAASSSSGSVSPREDGGEETNETPAPVVNPRTYRQEPWHECFNTRKQAEFEALIYSVYVMQRDDRKMDGYDYYECINRLQSKCRYKVRTKIVNEFFIVEERGAHNHAMEPVGSPGSHAGLPKTLREIVDSSFHNEWPTTLRQQKIEEEVKRLGLPHNPRLGRQIDNRIAYLRRVKNLTETRKIQEQMSNGMQMNGLPAIAPRPDIPQLNGANPDDFLKIMMQHIQNGGQLDQSMSQDIIEAQIPITSQNNDLPVSQPQIVVHENNAELMNVLMQVNKEGMPDQHIINILMSNGMMPPPPLEPMEEDSSSSSSPDDRLQIDD